MVTYWFQDLNIKNEYGCVNDNDRIPGKWEIRMYLIPDQLLAKGVQFPHHACENLRNEIDLIFDTVLCEMQINCSGETRENPLENELFALM